MVMDCCAGVSSSVFFGLLVSSFLFLFRLRLRLLLGDVVFVFVLGLDLFLRLQGIVFNPLDIVIATTKVVSARHPCCLPRKKQASIRFLYIQ
jgi:hypothetical protein